MNADEAIQMVKDKANMRTRYEGQEAFLDEVLVAEIERLKLQLRIVQDAIQDVLCSPCRLDKATVSKLQACRGQAIERFRSPAEVELIEAEAERLRADVERLKSVRTQLWNGIGVMRAALTDEQRRQVARICYGTTGLCFCGCHETEFEPMMAREQDNEPYIDLRTGR